MAASRLDLCWAGPLRLLTQVSCLGFMGWLTTRAHGVRELGTPRANPAVRGWLSSLKYFSFRPILGLDPCP